MRRYMRNYLEWLSRSGTGSHRFGFPKRNALTLGGELRKQTQYVGFFGRNYAMRMCSHHRAPFGWWLEPTRGCTLASAHLFWHQLMCMSIVGTRKAKPGRPPVGSTSINVRLPPDELSALDAHISLQDDKPTRPEAIRRLVRQALKER